MSAPAIAPMSLSSVVPSLAKSSLNSEPFKGGRFQEQQQKEEEEEEEQDEEQDPQIMGGKRRKVKGKSKKSGGKQLWH